MELKKEKKPRGRLFLVHPSGFEPETVRVGGENSIQLNYGCIYRFILAYFSWLVNGSPACMRRFAEDLRKICLLFGGYFGGERVNLFIFGFFC